MQVFISYAGADAEFAKILAQDLKRDGHEAFYAELLEMGASLAKALTDAIERSEAVLAVLSPAYVKSSWAQQELSIAVAGESRKRRTIIPLMRKPCSPPSLLAEAEFVDFTAEYEAGLNDLLRVLRELDVNGSNEESNGPESSNASTAVIGQRGTYLVGRDLDISHVEQQDTRELRELLGEMRAAVESFKREPDLRPATAETAMPDEQRRCFLIMPFGDEDLEVVYEDFVKPMLEKGCGLICERGDDVFGSNVIVDDILSSIQRANLIVADLTRKNANVFYEVGICHALGKPVLLLSQSLEDVPFDLRHRRILLYDYSPRGCKRLEVNLKDNIIAMITDERPPTEAVDKSSKNPPG